MNLLGKGMLGCVALELDISQPWKLVFRAESYSQKARLASLWALQCFLADGLYTDLANIFRFIEVS